MSTSITDREIARAASEGQRVLVVPADAIVSASAREQAQALNITIERQARTNGATEAPNLGAVPARGHGGGEWGPPLTSDEESPSRGQRAAAALPARGHGGGEWGPPLTANEESPSLSQPAQVVGAAPPHRPGGGEWGSPLTAADERPAAIVVAVSSPPPVVQPVEASRTSNGHSGLRPAARKRLDQLCDFDRIREAIARYGLDGVVLAVPHNVHYVSGLDTPPMWNFPWYAFAVVPRSGEPALVLSQLALSAPAEAELWIKDYWPFSRGEIIVYDASALLETESMIRDLRDSLAPRRSGTGFEAIGRVLADRGLSNGKLGFDDSRIIGRFPDAGFQPFDAIDLMREVRMIKTENEIARMRSIAIANEEAALAAARQIPFLPTWDDVVNHYRAELALRGGEAIYLLGGSPHHTGTHQHSYRDYPMAEGEFFMIDALGQKAHYYGDFGRTACWGEPNPEVLKRFNAMRKGFELGMELVRPGLKFEELSAKVTEAVRKAGLSNFTVCSPHSVGMEHTDMPRVTGHTVQVNMTMNIDLAYLEAGFGSLHLEDTFVVRQHGVELLTSGKTELLRVA